MIKKNIIYSIKIDKNQNASRKNINQNINQKISTNQRNRIVV